jgi:NADH-quinone oxidoreductase subunit N
VTGPVAFDAVALMPALAPAVAAVLVLVLDAVAPGLGRLHLPIAAAASTFGLVHAVRNALGDAGAARTLCLPAPDGRCFHDPGTTGSALQAAALLAGAVIALLLMAGSPVSRPGREASGRAGTLPDHAEGPGPSPATLTRPGPAVTAALLLSSVTGATVVAAGSDLGTWLVGLELATLPAVALVALRGGRAAGHGALSLLVTSVVSFGLLVLGGALWVVATGEVTFGGAGVGGAWGDPSRRPAFVVAVLLIVAGLGFKVSAVPFHTWTPPAYAGAGPAVAALLGTVSKVAALAGLVAVVAGVAPVADASGHPHAISLGLSLLAVLSMTVGNVIALRQDDLLRFLAWSTIAQSGWLLMPLAGVGGGARRASVAYLLTLVVGSLAAFAAVAHVGATRVWPGESRRHWAGALRRMPFAGVVLALGLLSLAGLPPALVGLVGKVVALRATVDAGLWWVAGIAVVNVVLGIAAYLRWVAILLDRPEPRTSRTTRPSRVTAFALGIAATALVATSVMPQIVLGLLP